MDCFDRNLNCGVHINQKYIKEIITAIDHTHLFYRHDCHEDEKSCEFLPLLQSMQIVNLSFHPNRKRLLHLRELLMRQEN
jgi:hypothetical protein